MPEWFDSSAATYTAESTIVRGHKVTVCLDDEGPLRPAFFWDITDPLTGACLTDGWASTVSQCRRDAIAAARALPKGDQ